MPARAYIQGNTVTTLLASMFLGYTCNLLIADLHDCYVRLDTPTYGITYHTAPLKMYGERLPR